MHHFASLSTRFRWLPAFLLVLTAGCSPFASLPGLAPSAPAQAPHSAHRAPIQFPIGRWITRSSPRLLVLSIRLDGHYEVYLDEVRVDAGIFTPAGSQVAVDSVECELAGRKPAVYAWLHEDAELAFQPAGADACDERRRYLAEPFEPQHLFIDVPPRYLGLSSQQWLRPSA